MADGGGLAIAVLIILGFAGFVLWAKTVHGKRILIETFGEPNTPPKKRTVRRRRPASRSGAAAKTTPKAAPKSEAIEAVAEPKRAAGPVRKPRS